MLFQFVDIGVVTGIEANHKPLPEARKGMEVCIKIESPPGEAPKMYGRHFDHTDLLVSKVKLRKNLVSVLNERGIEVNASVIWRLVGSVPCMFVPILPLKHMRLLSCN